MSDTASPTNRDEMETEDRVAVSEPPRLLALWGNSDRHSLSTDNEVFGQ